MTTKLKTLASEHRIITLLRERPIPQSFMSEINDFIERNMVHVESDGNHFCPRCLKAHIIKKADEYGVYEVLVDILKEINCEVGHLGYYMDGNELKKIN